MSTPSPLWTPPLNIAHRGASKQAPENTFAAFEAAIEAGASAVEMDLRFTADRRLVVLHDSTVDRTSDGSGAIARLTYDQARDLDVGSWFSPAFAGQRIPLLSEVVDRVLPRIPCVFHIKAASGLATEVVGAIDPEQRQRATISCSRLGSLAVLADRGVHLTWITYWRHWPGWTAWITRLARRKGTDRVAPKGSTVTPAMVQQVHRAQLLVRAWGVGADLEMARRLLSCGVDGMTFNDPVGLGKLLQRV